MVVARLVWCGLGWDGIGVKDPLLKLREICFHCVRTGLKSCNYPVLSCSILCGSQSVSQFNQSISQSIVDFK